jgi:hypothetical protein
MQQVQRILTIALVGSVLLAAGCSKSEPTGMVPGNPNMNVNKAPKGNPKKPMLTPPDEPATVPNPGK